MLALLLVAGSLAMDNLAVSIAIGLSGVDARLRLRIVVVFGLCEAGMPIIGLLIGRGVAGALGSHADLIAGCVIVAAGLYALIGGLRDDGDVSPAAAQESLARLLVTGLALSIDNLVVGFALGADHTPPAVAAIVIGLVSVAFSLVGLELGARLGERVERGSEMLGAGVLILVGIAIAAGLL